MAPAVHARNVQAAVVWSTAAGFPHLEVFAELQQNQVPAGWRPTNHQSFTMQLSLSRSPTKRSRRPSAKEGSERRTRISLDRLQLYKVPPLPRAVEVACGWLALHL